MVSICPHPLIPIIYFQSLFLYIKKKKEKKTYDTSSLAIIRPIINSIALRMSSQGGALSIVL